MTTMIKKLYTFVLAVILIQTLPLNGPIHAESTPVYTATVEILTYEQDEEETSWFSEYASGSGTLIRNDGIILTNSHVIMNDEGDVVDGIEICFTVSADEKPACTATASPIAWDETMDIALLKIDDVEGQFLDTLDYKDAPEVELEDELTIYGYPYTGGETITSSQGQVSGFEEYDGYTYVKTDAYLTFGNSGGTVVNENDEFVGVPTYLMGDLGYFLPLGEAESWIDQAINQAPTIDEEVQFLFQSHLEKMQEMEETSIYHHEIYPEFEWNIGLENWKFSEIKSEKITLINEPGLIIASFEKEDYPFEINTLYEEKILKDHEENFGLWSDDYSMEEVDFQGKKAYHIQFTEWEESENHMLLIPYGYTLIKINYYFFDLEKTEKNQETIQKLLDGFDFLEDAIANPEPMETFVSTEPDFSLNKKGDWFFQEKANSGGDNFFWEEEDEIEEVVRLIRPDDTKTYITLEKQVLTEEKKAWTNADLLKQELGIREYETIILTDDSLIMDGLEGWSLTSIDDIQGTKSFDIFLRYSQDTLLKFHYTDWEENYKERLGEVKMILETFQHGSPEFQSTGEFKIGSLEDGFSDVRYHRYEREILNLYNLGLIEGYTDGTFRPENLISRAEAVKVLVVGKFSSEASEEDIPSLEETLEKFMQTEYRHLDFEDTQKSWATPYLRYAHSQKYIQGYRNGYRTEFNPSKSISLVESLSLLFKVFEVPYWQNPSTKAGWNWQKPIMDKGYEWGLIPEGMSDPNMPLTRAEFSALVSEFL